MFHTKVNVLSLSQSKPRNELFEKVDSVAHYNYQDSNRGPLNFVKI
jgi:hypothetical protein